MREVLLPRSIGVSIERHANLLAEHFRKLEDLKEFKRTVRETLLKLAPKGLRGWLIGDSVRVSVMGNLFEFGVSKRKIVFDSPPFGTLKQTRRKMARLTRAWQGQVSVELDKHPESERIGVKFRA